MCAALAWTGALPAAEPVDINSASAESLAAAMSGVGMKRAQAIVEHRDRNGPFESVDELAEVSGIGPHIIEQSRDRITVKPAAP
ncbi:MAG: helix-hairpin-helix domain-containing protein [Gammaproteobacteria bacterium]|nr:helix-hairpin-helix domain-containing protein [Gammaproteobacteria bacterium]